MLAINIDQRPQHLQTVPDRTGYRSCSRYRDHCCGSQDGKTEKEIRPRTELDRISAGTCSYREHDLLWTNVQHDLTGYR